MHSIVRRFIKTGLGFLAAGLLLGLYLVARRELEGAWPSAYLVTAHAHLLLVGFVMFMILGVALWLFPRPRRDDTRYRPARVEVSYWLLLAGTLARFGGEVARGGADGAVLRWLVLLGSLSQVLGFVVFGWTMWPRIRAAGSRVREEEGERF
jgi:heme/copper-type cytochrome/quinol oxidase subunit 1